MNTLSLSRRTLLAGAAVAGALTQVQRAAADTRQVLTKAVATDVASLPRVKVKLVDPPFVHEHEQVATGGPKVVEFDLLRIYKQELTPEDSVDSATLAQDALWLATDCLREDEPPSSEGPPGTSGTPWEQLVTGQCVVEVPEGIVVLPHIGGPHPQRDKFVARLFVENLGRFLDGTPLKEVVDRTAGY